MAEKIKSEAQLSAARVKRELEARFNPIRGLGPVTLVRYLEAYEAGEYDRAARLFDQIEARDPQVRSVAPKRKRAAALHARNWEILTTEDSPKAQKHKEALETLYNNLRWRDGMNRNRTGGVYHLVKAMMDAVGKGFSVHELLWRPMGNRYTVEAVFVPLWYFEAKQGDLRFLEREMDTFGTELEPGGWMIASGEGIMSATAAAWMYKSLSMKDWLILSEHFGFPWVHGKTEAQQGSEDWDNFVSAIGGLSRDAQIVTNMAAELDLHNIGGAGESPQKPLVEYMDRAITTLWRGGDLSTMSRSDGVGAMPQEEEREDIEVEDCLMISEALHEYIDRWALRYIFGQGVEPLAYISVTPPSRLDESRELEKYTKAVEMGVELSVRDFRERFNLPAPAEGDELLTKAAAPAGPGGFLPGMNEGESLAADRAMETDLTRNAAASIRLSRLHALRPVIERVREIVEGPDEDVEAGLRSLIEELPMLADRVGADRRTVEAWEEVIGAAMATGVSDEEQR